MDGLLSKWEFIKLLNLTSSGKKLPFISGQELYIRPSSSQDKKAPNMICIIIRASMNNNNKFGIFL